MNKKKIIFVYPHLFTFIRTEISLLSKHFNILHINQKWNNKILLPLNLLYQLIFLLVNIRKCTYVLISFAGYWSLIPVIIAKFFGIRNGIVVHGTDCVDFKDINYGSLRKPFLKWFIKKSLQLTDIILPVSESLVYTKNTYFSDDNLNFGYSYHLGIVNTPYKVIPNGLIIDDWKIKKTEKKQNTFISVMTKDQVLRKGGDLIIEFAKIFPKGKFYFAGLDEIANAPSNVICLGRLSPDELKNWYSKTQFYLQLSNFEGFGVAICEAMLCSCIPIVSNVNFLPEIVGKTGLILKKRNAQMLLDAFNDFIKKDLNSLGDNAKERIISNFSSDNRQDMLISILK